MSAILDALKRVESQLNATGAWGVAEARAAAEESIAQLTAAATQLQAELSRQQEAYQELSQRREAESKAWRGAVETAQSQARALRELLANREEFHGNAAQRMAHLNAEVNRLSRQVEGLREELAQSRAAEQAHEETLARLRSANPLSFIQAASGQGGGEKRTEGPRRKIGELFVNLGMVGHEHLEGALKEQASEPGRRVGSLLAGAGHVSDEEVARVLARQLGISYIWITREVVDAAAVMLVKQALASRHVCIPIALASGHLVLAMANPLDLTAIEDVEHATGKRVIPVAATAANITKALTWFPADA